jgi:hypothetical protein
MKNEHADYPTRDKSLIGAAGVHFVASQLSLRGLIALPTIRNTAGVDIVVVNQEGELKANLQVKTSRSRVDFWPVGTRYPQWRSQNNSYVFVRYNPKIDGLEAFLDSSFAVAESVDQSEQDVKERGLKAWSPCYYPKGELERLRSQWEEFGRSTQ